MKKILFASLFLTTFSLNAFALDKIRQDQVNQIIDEKKKEVIVNPPPAKEEPKPEIVQAPVEQKPVEQKPVEEQKPAPIVQTPASVQVAPVQEAPKTKLVTRTRRRWVPADPLDNAESPRGGHWETYTETVEVPVDAPVAQKPVVDQKPIADQKPVYNQNEYDYAPEEQEEGGHSGGSSVEQTPPSRRHARQRPEKQDNSGLGLMSTEELLNTRISPHLDDADDHGVDLKNCTKLIAADIDEICTAQKTLKHGGHRYKHVENLDHGYMTIQGPIAVKANSKRWINRGLWSWLDKGSYDQEDYLYGECSDPAKFGWQRNKKHFEVDQEEGKVATSQALRTAQQYCQSFRLKHSIFDPAKFYRNKLDTVRKILKDAETDGSEGAEDRRENLRQLERRLVSSAMNPAVQSAIAAYKERRAHDGVLNSKAVLSLRGPRAGIRITKNAFRRVKNIFRHNKEELIPRDDAMTQYSLSGDVLNSEDFSAYAAGSQSLSLEEVFGDKRGNYIRTQVLQNRTYGKSTYRSVASSEDDSDMPPLAPDRFSTRGGLSPR